MEYGAIDLHKQRSVIRIVDEAGGRAAGAHDHDDP